MPSSRKTNPWGLSQFDPGDAPGMDDWNEDNRRIVTALAEVGKATLKAPYIGENLHFWIYDAATKMYIDSGISVPIGPANEITIGTVEPGEEAAATITGDAPNQVLNLVLPQGEQGPPGTGTGYMQQDAYDPTGKNADAFSMGNMVETSEKKIMTAAERTKLGGVATNANNYVHPTNHAPSIIMQDENNRFTTDIEKASWNGKQAALGFTPVSEDTFDAHKSRHATGGADALTPDDIGAVKKSGSYVDPEQATMPRKVITADYTLTAADNGYRILANSASQITVTINTQVAGAYAADYGVVIQRIGAGDIAIAGVSGVTFRAPGSRMKVAEVYGSVAVLKDADNLMSLIGSTKS